MELELLKFINENDDWMERLAAEPYNLRIKEKDGFVKLNYSKFSSDFDEPIVGECRGITIHKASKKIVCFPFTAFYNYNEERAAKFDWVSAKVWEKVDGSFITLWNYSNKWHWSTMSNIDAVDALTGDTVYPNFQSLIYHAIGGINKAYKFLNGLDKNKTYMFELVSPVNRVVVPYDGFKLYYLGERDNTTFQEAFDEDLVETCDFLEQPRSYLLSSFDVVVSMAKQMGWDEEGFVVCDKDFNRVKVKSTAWLDAHYAMNNGVITTRRLIEMILSGDTDEFINYLPEYQKAVQTIKNLMVAAEQNAKFSRLCFEENDYFKLDGAEFAEKTKLLPKWLQGYIFKVCRDPSFTWNENVKEWTAREWENVKEWYNV